MVLCEGLLVALYALTEQGNEIIFCFSSDNVYRNSPVKILRVIMRIIFTEQSKS